MKKKLLCFGALAVCLSALLLFLLVWNGVILLNNPSPQEYPVRGVDVSAYQGEIDWETLSAQDLSFAFIKATEGSSFVDPHFSYSYEAAQKTDLRIGAYHFFSYDSAGQTQAENFITAVQKTDNMLPPVIDLEFYADKEANPPARVDVEKQLNAMLAMLEAHYGMKPIIYATEKSYRLFLAGDYQNYDIWIRNVLTAPRLSDNRAWTFWQYTDRAQLEGYTGREKFIDVNVFYGSAKEFSMYGKEVATNEPERIGVS